jgi:hypothetical protein
MDDRPVANHSRSGRHDARRVRRTAEAIYGTFITEKFDDVFLIRSLDFILIELEGSFAVQVKSGDEDCTFNTSSAGGTIPSERVIEFPAGATFRVLCIQGASQADCQAELATATRHLELILSAIEEYAAAEILKVGNRINSAINILSKKAAVVDESRNTPIDRSSDNPDLLDSFIKRLDPLVHDAADVCFFPSRVVGSARCLRLFFFHQLESGAKTHMRLHPLASQLTSVAGEYLRDAQRENWNFDEVANRGVVSWIRLARDHSGNEIFQNYLERLAGDHISQNDGADPYPEHAGLAIPMHIGGKAWLIVLFVFAAVEENRVELAHYVLRNTVPILFENIASLVKDEYLNLIRWNARNSLLGGKFDAADLNARLRYLSQIFPYNKEWYLSTEDNDVGVTAFGETKFLHDRSIGAADELLELEFRTVDREAVRNKLQDTAREVRDEMEAQQGADEGIGHALKNIVELTSWPQALSQIRSLDRNYHRLIERNDHQEVLARLRFASRSLGLFSLVAGLGHFARLSGAIGRGDFGKFGQWHDENELSRWNSNKIEDVRSICDAFVDTVCRIVAPLCASLSTDGEPHLFEIRCAHAQQNIVNGGTVEEHDRLRFDKRLLHVPPFKKGSDAAYSFVFALTEPLINALRALEELRQHSILSPSERVLRIRIEPRLPDEVVFSVINSTAATIQKTLSGFRTTRRMLRRVGIAELSNPKVQELRPGAYDVIAEVHFKPYELAKKIAEQSEGKDAKKFEIASD